MRAEVRHSNGTSVLAAKCAVPDDGYFGDALLLLTKLIEFFMSQRLACAIVASTIGVETTKVKNGLGDSIFRPAIDFLPVTISCVCVLGLRTLGLRGEIFSFTTRATGG